MIVYLGEQFQPLESIKQTLANQNLTINFFGDRSTPYCKTLLIFPIRITSIRIVLIALRLVGMPLFIT